MIRHMMVAMKANAIESRKTLEYCESVLMFESEKCPLASVSAKYTTNIIGTMMKSTIQTICGAAAIR